jgi:small-conductance mechanosensitive channel/CRP-like cAMP-binding protein
MSSYLMIAVVSALLVVAGRLPALRMLRSLALPFGLLAVTASWLALVEGIDLEGTFWASAAETAFLVVLGYLAGRVLVLLVFDWMLVRRMGLPVPHLARDVASLVIQLAVIGTVLKVVLNIELTALFATSAVITVIIGLSLQQTLGNLLAGIAVAWEGRLKPGDWVRVGDMTGEVTEPGWRSIVLQTVLDERVVIPNAKLTEERITLLGSGRNPVALEVSLSVSYSVPPDAVQRVLMEVLRGLPDGVAEPAPEVLTRELADNGILYVCRVWTRTPWRDSRLRSNLLTRAYSALTREGMEIPFPQRTVHMASPAKPVDRTAVIQGALERCDLFRGLPGEAVASVAGDSRLLRFAPGEPVVREGDGSNAMYAIVSGEADVSQRGAGADAVVGRLAAGQAFGEVAFLTGRPRAATIRAVGPLSVVEIDAQGLRGLVAGAPELAEELARRVAAHDRAASEAAARVSGKPAPGRITVADLLGSILRRFGR